jgi:hypothetical protein
MRDFKLQFIDEVGFDINIVNGYPEYVDYENQTQDQRAAIGAVFEKSTLPGHPEFGVDWGKLYDKENALVDIDNDVKQTVSTVAGGTGEASQTYLPLYEPQEDGSVKVIVMKGTI